LVPHRIGDNAIKGAEFALSVSELGILEGVANLDLALHVVDDHAHVSHSPCFWGEFLAKQFLGDDSALFAHTDCSVSSGTMGR